VKAPPPAHLFCPDSPVNWASVSHSSALAWLPHRPKTPTAASLATSRCLLGAAPLHLSSSADQMRCCLRLVSPGLDPWSIGCRARRRHQQARL